MTRATTAAALLVVLWAAAGVLGWAAYTVAHRGELGDWHA